MVFSSITFLFYFLPAVLILYYAAPRKLRNGLLFFASLVFYAWGEPVYVVLIIFSTLVEVPCPGEAGTQTPGPGGNGNPSPCAKFSAGLRPYGFPPYEGRKN